MPLGKIAKRVAKAVTKRLPPVAPVIQAAYKPHGSRPALGLRYTMLKKTGDEPVEVDAESVFHAGAAGGRAGDRRAHAFAQGEGPLTNSMLWRLNSIADAAGW